MRKAIYKAIADRLAASGLGVGFVSLWNRNTEQLTTQKAFRLPAVFVEFEPILWSQLAQGARSAEVRVRLHVVTATSATPEIGGKYADKALALLDYLESVAGAVQGLTCEGFNRFMLVETTTDHDHEKIRHDQLCYVTRVTDLAGVRTPTVAEGVALSVGRGK